MKQFWFDETMFAMALKSKIMLSDKNAQVISQSDLIHLIDFSEYKKEKSRADFISEENKKLRLLVGRKNKINQP